MSKILVVDDDTLLVELLVHKFAREGFDVRAAADGSAALEEIAREAPDLIILDAMMPGQDGFQVLRRLSEDPDTDDIPVVMLTAKRQEQDMLAGLTLGATEYLVKPFSPDILVAKVQKILGIEPDFADASEHSAFG